MKTSNMFFLELSFCIYKPIKNAAEQYEVKSVLAPQNKIILMMYTYNMLSTFCPRAVFATHNLGLHDGHKLK